MDEALVERWIEGYLKAWRTNDPEDIGRSSPRRPVLHGATPGAVAGASGHHRRVDRTEGRAGPVGLPSRDRGSGRRCGLRPGLDRLSGQPTAYSNLWVIRLDQDGRCSEFTEWWMAAQDD